MAVFFLDKGDAAEHSWMFYGAAAVGAVAIIIDMNAVSDTKRRWRGLLN